MQHIKRLRGETTREKDHMGTCIGLPDYGVSLVLLQDSVSVSCMHELIGKEARSLLLLDVVSACISAGPFSRVIVDV